METIKQLLHSQLTLSTLYAICNIIPTTQIRVAPIQNIGTSLEAEIVREDNKIKIYSKYTKKTTDLLPGYDLIINKKLYKNIQTIEELYELAFEIYRACEIKRVRKEQDEIDRCICL